MGVEGGEQALQLFKKRKNWKNYAKLGKSIV